MSRHRQAAKKAVSSVSHSSKDCALYCWRKFADSSWRACAPDQDADSATPEGEKAEGAFYVWAADEIDEVLGTDSERARLFARHYSVEPGGNATLSPRRCGSSVRNPWGACSGCISF
jgi:uncharacterized protein YyaL (SSP411 family)